MANDPSVDLFDSRKCTLGEGPFYDAMRGLIGWVDILQGRFLWQDAAGKSGQYDFDTHVGAVLPCDDGCFIACLRDGVTKFKVDSALTDFKSEWHTPYGHDSKMFRANDAKCDATGRLYTGTMRYDTSAPEAKLYRLDAHTRRLDTVFEAITISNGLAWSQDGKRLFYIDTPTRKIDVCDVREDSSVVNRRLHCDVSSFAGYPDGMAIDAEDGLWVAFWGGACVRRFDAHGRLSAVLDVPAKFVTSCAFVGAKLDRLIITTAAHDGSDNSPHAGMTFITMPTICGAPVGVFKTGKRLA